MNRRESYKVKATVDNIELAIDPVIEALEEIDVSPKICYQIRLALDEIITNVVSYAYESDDGEVEIKYEINDENMKKKIETMKSENEKLTQNLNFLFF